MAFNDLDILFYFRSIFKGIGIPENNISLGYNFRDKTNQNLPSVLIKRSSEKIDKAGCGREVQIKGVGGLLNNFHRVLNLEIAIKTNFYATGKEWQIGKITSQFFREAGIGRFEFDVGTFDDTNLPDDQKRCAVIKNISIAYDLVSNAEGKPVEVAKLKIPIEYFEYSTKG